MYRHPHRLAAVVNVTRFEHCAWRCVASNPVTHSSMSSRATCFINSTCGSINESTRGKLSPKIASAGDNAHSASRAKGRARAGQEAVVVSFIYVPTHACFTYYFIQHPN